MLYVLQHDMCVIVFSESVR